MAFIDRTEIYLYKAMLETFGDVFVGGMGETSQLRFEVTKDTKPFEFARSLDSIL